MLKGHHVCGRMIGLSNRNALTAPLACSPRKTRNSGLIRFRLLPDALDFMALRQGTKDRLRASVTLCFVPSSCSTVFCTAAGGGWGASQANWPA